jgi:hypothetical protein
MTKTTQTTAPSAPREGTPQAACCDTIRQATCCEPAEKPGCCGTSPAGQGCGCQADSGPAR